VVDGTTGLLVPPGDPAALAGALQRLVDDRGLRDRFGAAGRALAEDRHSAARFQAAHLELYATALRDRVVTVS
jgi:rhamnosyl/mannosyltransferase